MNEIESTVFQYRILYQYLELDVLTSDSISEMKKSLKELNDQFEAIVKLIKEKNY